MGLIEAVTPHISFSSVTLVVLGALTLRYIVFRIDEHIHIKRLGNYATKVSSWAPFGLDFTYGIVMASRRYTLPEYWRDHLVASPSYTCEARTMGRRLIFTADPDNIKAVLALQFSDFGKGHIFHDSWKDFLGDSIFTTDGTQWYTSRQLIRPQFTRDRVSDLECFESHVETLFRAIDNGGPLDGHDHPVRRGAGSGRPLDISDLFFRYTLDVITEFLLGGDTGSLSSPRNEFADAFNEVQRIQNYQSRAGQLRPLLPKAAFKRGLDVMNRFVNSFIQRALRLSPDELAARTEGDKKGSSFLHVLAGFTRDPKVLRDQIVSVLLAGRDTTASTLSWAVYELARHPAAVARLRREVLDTVGAHDTPTYAHLKNMPYLKAVLNETLRLYPSVPFNVRLSMRDTTLPRGGGPDGSEPLTVLRGTPVAYSPLLMQRRPDLYPPVSGTFAHPDVFSPDRWLHWHPRPHDYIPFNAGPRICVGQQFALTEMSYVLCRLLQRFDRITSHMHDIDGGVPFLKADVILSPGDGVRVAFWDAKG
ncbi:Cytochrome P450 [Geosmithia morbida]|uniref:Cytochrome P450 n=1 Tax=Geosmithia morbida TaxID=1094350 RepID=A0A9P4YT31_9HYPO|nr:Cytochrome P450 [Geosmithia morbida]KAF4122603.1 Cytochrome P450 [Geosmithia morbida]